MNRKTLAATLLFGLFAPFAAAQATAVISLQLPPTGVTAGSYTCASQTIDQFGRITAAANGSCGSVTQSIAALWEFHDSYGYGSGATVPTTKSMFALVSQDTPAAAYNFSQPGTTVAQITNNLWLNYQASPTLPSVVIVGGGENDSNTCSSATATCGLSFQNMYMGADARVIYPDAYRMWASNATKTGTWANDTSVTFQPTLTTVVGNPVTTSTASSTLTFNPTTPTSSTKVGVTYRVVAGQAGSFTVSIDGNLVTDNISSSTTFSSAPGSASSPAITSSGAFYRQEYAVTGATSHTIVVTNTGGANNIEIVSVDWLPPPATVNLSHVFQMAVGLGWANNAVWNQTLQNLAAIFNADGPANAMNFVDLTNGTPGLNNTTDLSTSATAQCPASTTSNHPNDCGYLHMYQTFVNKEASSGYQFSSYNKGTVVASNPNFGTALQVTQNPATHASAFSSFNVNTIGGGTLPNGVDTFQSANHFAGQGVYTDSSTGKPWSGQYVSALYGSSGPFWECLSAQNGSTGNASSDYTSLFCTDPSGNAYFTKTLIPATIFSAAGVSLPSCAVGLKGTLAVVSDATSPTYMGAYTSGGTITASVICSYNGTAYAWLTH